MKARYRKRKLETRYAQVVAPTTSPVKSSTIAWASAVENLLVKKVDPLPELIDDNFDVVTEKRQRGRPKKRQLDHERDDKYTHKIEWDEASSPVIQPQRMRSIIADFRLHYITNQIPLQRSLDRIAQAYKISYKQAHSLLQSEF